MALYCIYIWLHTRKQYTILVDIVNPLTTNVPHHIETSQLICSANQLTGFCMRETLAFKGLNKDAWSPINAKLKKTFQEILQEINVKTLQTLVFLLSLAFAYWTVHCDSQEYMWLRVWVYHDLILQYITMCSQKISFCVVKTKYEEVA